MISFIDDNFKNLSKKEIEIISDYMTPVNRNRQANSEFLAWIITMRNLNRDKELNYEEIRNKFIATVNKVSEGDERYTSIHERIANLITWHKSS
jgi:hypothetical protein